MSVNITEVKNTVTINTGENIIEIERPESTVIVSDTGIQGAGVPSGGSTNQALIKTSNTSYATGWANIANSVNSKTGAVTLDKSDVGLSNVDNTSDANKPISTATQTALDAKLDDTQLDTDGTLAANSDSKIASQKATKTYTDTGLATKEPTITAGTTGQYWRGDKSFQTLNKTAVGLGNVDNTSDANKPISSATQTALDGKVDENAAITGATKTKITYDAKGLVTAGTDAGISDISGLQTALNNKLETSLKGAPSGLAELDANSKVPSSQLPAIAITEVYTVNSQAQQLALVADEGDVAIRTDLNKSFVHNGGTAGTMADWSELLTPTDVVLSVNNMTGAVTIDKTSVGLGNVTNDAQVKYTAPQLGGNLDLNAKAISIIGTAGENLVAGNLCYLKNDGKYWKASNTASATASTKLAIANATINADATGELIVYGQVTTSGLSAGANYFVGAAGAITATSPTTEDYVVRPIGTALSTTVLEFNPDTTWITYKA